MPIKKQEKEIKKMEHKIEMEKERQNKPTNDNINSIGENIKKLNNEIVVKQHQILIHKQNT